MYVCVCNAVTESQVLRAAEEGVRRLEVELKTARAAEAVARAEAAELRQRLDTFETGVAVVDMGRRLMSFTEVIEELRPAQNAARRCRPRSGSRKTRRPP